MTTSDWILTKPWQSKQFSQAFKSLDAVFQLQGEIITKDQLSEVILTEVSGVRFYVKRYTQAGKNLRKYLGVSRIRSEWENLYFFRRLSIPTANIVGFGEERGRFFFKRGALITEEVPKVSDLDKMTHCNHALLKNRYWVKDIINQIADIARKLHDHRFIHIDFKWRNILATMESKPKIYMIDCPSGRMWHNSVLFNRVVDRGIIKDLACLDKTAKDTLSRSQRLYFYKRYLGISKLLSHHKRQIHRIMTFFEGRE